MWLHLVTLLALLLGDAPPGGSSIARAAGALADGLGPVAPEERSLALAVTAAGPARQQDALRAAVQAALLEALEGRGLTVSIVAGGEPAEEAARSRGADLLLAVRVAVTGAALTLSGEAVPTRPNFFLQRGPYRPRGTRFVTASAPRDALVNGLAPRAAGPLTVQILATVPGRVRALAAGPGEPGGVVQVVAVTSSEVLLLDARGAVLDRWPWPPPPPGPRVRDPGAAAVVVAGHATCALAGRTGAVAFALGGGRLTQLTEADRSRTGGAGGTAPGRRAPGDERASPSAGSGQIAPPGLLAGLDEAREGAASGRLVVLAANDAGLLSGSFVHGRGILDGALALAPASPSPPGPLAPVTAAGETSSTAAPNSSSPALAPAGAPPARFTAPAALFAVAAAPRAGRIAFAAADVHGALSLLSPSLQPAAPPVSGAGAGLALANLDGDGENEVVTSSIRLDLPDTLRVWRPGTPPRLLLETPVSEGSLLAGTAANLTGDGLDDALLAAATSGATALVLISADARPRGEGSP